MCPPLSLDSVICLHTDGLPLFPGSHRRRSGRQETADVRRLFPVRGHVALAQPALVGGGGETTRCTDRRTGGGSSVIGSGHALPLPPYDGGADGGHRHRPRGGHPRHRTVRLLPPLLPRAGRHPDVELRPICLGDIGPDGHRGRGDERGHQSAGPLAAPALRRGRQLQVLPIHINNMRCPC